MGVIMEEKIKKFWKKHRYEIVLMSVGGVTGYALAKNHFYKRENLLVDFLNQEIEIAFDQYQGNFQTPDGEGYTIPVLQRVS
jgi:hypothetical protein